MKVFEFFITNNEHATLYGALRAESVAEAKAKLMAAKTLRVARTDIPIIAFRNGTRLRLFISGRTVSARDPEAYPHYYIVELADFLINHGRVLPVTYCMETK